MTSISSDCRTDVVTVFTEGPQGPPGPPGIGSVSNLDDLADVTTVSKVDKSLLYYDSASGQFKADATWTTTTIVDGANF